MRRAVVLAVVLLTLSGLAVLTIGLPAGARPPSTPAAPEWTTITLEAKLEPGVSGPWVLDSTPVVAGNRFVVESISRSVRLPVTEPGTQILNHLAITPAGEPGPVGIDQILRSYAVNTWSDNPVYRFSNLNGAFWPTTTCGTDQQYTVSNETNEMHAVVNGGEQMGITMLWLGSPLHPTCGVTVIYQVTGWLTAAS